MVAADFGSVGALRGVATLGAVDTSGEQRDAGGRQFNWLCEFAAIV
jgi:hypothetical protein